MRKALLLALAASMFTFSATSWGQTKVTIGYSGWTGFAPLTLARDAGIFKKNGLDVDLRKIPQKDRHLAIASGDVQCAATTVETWIVWNANGVATKQIFQMDKSYGADGMAVRSNIQKVSDVKGKTVAASAPGTAPYFVFSADVFALPALEATARADGLGWLRSVTERQTQREFSVAKSALPRFDLGMAALKNAFPSGRASTPYGNAPTSSFVVAGNTSSGWAISASSRFPRALGTTLNAAKNSMFTTGTKKSPTSELGSRASRSRRSVTRMPIHTKGSATATIVR